MKPNVYVSRMKKTPSRRITGQGMTEYIIVVALVALTAVVAVGAFGDTIQAQFSAMSSKLVGESGDAALGAGRTAAAAAKTEAGAKDTLKSYAQ